MTHAEHKRGCRWAAVVIGAASLVLANASPALAASGSGSGTGIYEITGVGISGNPPCAEISAFSYTGSFTGTLGDYNGPITVEFEATDTFYEGPMGTHGQDDTCNSSTAGTPIPVTGSAIGMDTPDSVSCDFDDPDSEYSRVGNDDTSAELIGDCDIVVPGGTSVSNSATTMEITGVIGECEGEIPPPPDECESTDSYVAS